MRKIHENTKVTLTFEQLKRLVSDPVSARVLKERSVDIKTTPIDTSSLKVQGGLNPRVWIQSRSGTVLNPSIRRRLLKIARDFVDSLDLSSVIPSCSPELFIPDVVLLGSLASYNWSRFSDFDLHVLVNYNVLGFGEKTKELLKQYFMRCKNEWNMKHSELTVLGYDVELYVQGVEKDNAANGVYSLLKDKWIKFPKKMSNDFSEDIVRAKANWFIQRIETLDKCLDKESPDYGRIRKIAELLKDKLLTLRRNSLDTTKDEMVEGNLVFKALRRSNHIELLNAIMNAAYDGENSL